MHHLKEVEVDGVKFVLIPEALHDKLASHIQHRSQFINHDVKELVAEWEAYDPEIFKS